MLVTGMSGTGKSTVLAELARRGYRVVDTDDDGWSEDVPLPDGSGVEHLWREDLMSALLAQDGDETLFVSGCTSNQSSFYDRFDAVMLLTAPTEVLLERLATRTTNPFGKDRRSETASSGSRHGGALAAPHGNGRDLDRGAVTGRRRGG
jgi:broad-specificity NMP kinase